MSYNDFPPGDISEDDMPCNCHDRIEDKLDKVLAISEKVETLAANVAAQIKPVLDAIEKSPLTKMLGIKL